MTISAVHLFYDVYMGFSHATLNTLLLDAKEGPMKRNEIAVFVNESFSAVKLLTSDNTLLYYRAVGPGIITPEVIRYLPTQLGGEKLQFSRNLEKALLDEWAKRGYGDKAKGAKRLRVVNE
jgi:hypothetical protein